MLSNKSKKLKTLTFAAVGFSMIATASFAGQNWNNNDQNKNKQQSGQNWNNNDQNKNNQQSNNNNQTNNHQSGNDGVVKKLKDLGYWDENAKLIAKEMDAKNINALKAVQNLNDHRAKGDEIPIREKDKLEKTK